MDFLSVVSNLLGLFEFDVPSSSSSDDDDEGTAKQHSTEVGEKGTYQESSASTHLSICYQVPVKCGDEEEAKDEEKKDDYFSTTIMDLESMKIATERLRAQTQEFYVEMVRARYQPLYLEYFYIWWQRYLLPRFYFYERTAVFHERSHTLTALQYYDFLMHDSNAAVHEWRKRCIYPLYNKYLGDISLEPQPDLRSFAMKVDEFCTCIATFGVTDDTTRMAQHDADGGHDALPEDAPPPLYERRYFMSSQEEIHGLVSKTEGTLVVSLLDDEDFLSLKTVPE